jgi:hypothetical protein
VISPTTLLQRPGRSRSFQMILDRTDSSKVELPDCYHLTILQINGTPRAELEGPLTPGDSDILRIRIRPLHPVNAEPQEGPVAMAELREMEKYDIENRRALARALSGDSGDHEVKLARQWIEKIRERALRSRQRSPYASGDVKVRSVSAAVRECARDVFSDALESRHVDPACRAIGTSSGAATGATSR